MRKVLLFFCLTGAGFGGTIQLTGLPINTEFGTFNGFALAMIDGVADQVAIGDDFNHTTDFPSRPLAYRASSLSGMHPLQFARFVNPADWDASIARYEQAAILLDGLQHTGPGMLLDLTADYQYALWHLFTPSVQLPRGAAQTLLDDAARSVATASAENMEKYGRLRILTPVGRFDSTPEFLQLAGPSAPTGWLAPPNPVPEPKGAVLIGTGTVLLGIGFAMQRKRQNRAATFSATQGSSPRASEPEAPSASS